MMEFVLCQDCLRVRPYSEEYHQNILSCSCGGDMCGCHDCSRTARMLTEGYYVGVMDVMFITLHELSGYTPENGLCLPIAESKK